MLPGTCDMSQHYRLRQSRDRWKCKARERADEIRQLRKERARLRSVRDRLKEELKDARARQRQVASHNRGAVIEHKAELVFLALQLFLVAHIGFRAVSRVLGVLAGVLGIKKAPCPQTVINWVTRLSMVRIQSASTLKGLPLERAPSCNGLIWMIDMSIALGTAKILTVLAINAHHHQLVPQAPGFQHVHCITVSVADSWTGETIAALLQRLIDVMGKPAGYLKDGAADLRKAIRLLDERQIGSPSIDDVSHVVANLLKHWYCDHPMFETFVSACGRVSAKLKQTILACLAPPKAQTKARFMNVHRLIRWADLFLKLSPPGGAKVGSTLAKLRACMDGLPSCRAFIKRFHADAVPLLECQKILKTKGLSRRTRAQCEALIQTIPSVGVRHGFQAYIQEQFDVATNLGVEEIGLPISSDPIESLFGLAKHHGVGDIKDADRIAIRLPALCGIPTRSEAEQVLNVSVADQNEITKGFSSLIKQRREVLPNPERLENLAADQPQAHMTLIPDAKNRGKSLNSHAQSMPYQKPSGPLPSFQSRCHGP
jgi:hypothetical protein